MSTNNLLSYKNGSVSLEVLAMNSYITWTVYDNRRI